MLLAKVRAAAVLVLSILLAGTAAAAWFGQNASSPKGGGGKALSGRSLAHLADEDDRSPPGLFPRRLLAIGVHGYPYANPVDYGTGEQALDKIVAGLGKLLSIPEEQVALLSDRAPTPYPPTRALIEKTIGAYLDTSRDQDRIILLFVGHVAKIDDVPYLVPIFGETASTETLIPLSWLYERLEKCKARQKVLILDVCRFDPVRGVERGRVVPLGANLDAALKAPPRGVQVLSACGGGEHSYEFNSDKLEITGGLFLSALGGLPKDDQFVGLKEKPEDSLPIEALFQAVQARTSAAAKANLHKPQTPRLTGVEAPSDLKYDPQAPGPRRLRIELAMDGTDELAGAVDVEAILSFVNSFPPIRQGDKATPLGFAALPPFAKERLAEYQDDGKRSEFRGSVVQAAKFLNDQYRLPALKDRIGPPIAEGTPKTQFMQGIEATQKDMAMAFFQVDRKLAELEADQDERDKENKLWQAGYDYMKARLLLRKAFLMEYQEALADIRKEQLPPFDKEIHKGFRLAKRAMTGREASPFLNEARKLLGKIAQDHKGTPWELIAKQAKVTSIGLEWQTY